MVTALKNVRNLLEKVCVYLFCTLKKNKTHETHFKLLLLNLRCLKMEKKPQHILSQQRLCESLFQIA